MKVFDFSSGQASGPDFGDIFLPSIVGGIYLGSKVFIEANYMLGIGYYFPTNNLYMEGMMIECEEDY